jgi:hypothetical protein
MTILDREAGASEGLAHSGQERLEEGAIKEGVLEEGVIDEECLRKEHSSEGQLREK